MSRIIIVHVSLSFRYYFTSKLLDNNFVKSIYMHQLHDNQLYALLRTMISSASQLHFDDNEISRRMNSFLVFIRLWWVRITELICLYVIYSDACRDFINIVDIIFYLISQRLITRLDFLCDFWRDQFFFFLQIQLRILHLSFILFEIMLTIIIFALIVAEW